MPKFFARQSKRKKALIVIGVVAVICAGLAIADAANIIDIPGFKDKTLSGNTEGKVNYGPPTDEEKKETEEFKSKQGASSDTASQKPASPGEIRSVKPVLTSWGQDSGTKNVDGSGYVPGIVEAGGTCTLTATMGAVKVSESIPATQNAQNMSCGAITIPRSKLSAGSWALTLSYSSDASRGTSQTQVQEVK